MPSLLYHIWHGKPQFVTKGFSCYTYQGLGERSRACAPRLGEQAADERQRGGVLAAAQVQRGQARLDALAQEGALLAPRPLHLLLAHLQLRSTCWECTQCRVRPLRLLRAYSCRAAPTPPAACTPPAARHMDGLYQMLLRRPLHLLLAHLQLRSTRGEVHQTSRRPHSPCTLHLSSCARRTGSIVLRRSKLKGNRARGGLWVFLTGVPQSLTHAAAHAHHIS